MKKTIVDHGQLVKRAPLVELAGDTIGAVLARSPRPEALIAALAAGEISAAAADGDWVRVSGAGIEEVGRRAEKSGVPIFETKSESANLEEVFLTLIHHADSQGAER